MNNTLIKAVSTAGAFVVAGTAAKLLNSQQRTNRRRRRGEDVEFGAVHSRRRTVVANDDLKINVEIDDGPKDAPTIVFVHGWLCTLDTWHYQRLALRGEARMIFFDQRSHGNSGRADKTSSSITNLADDLKAILDKHAPRQEIILVGHSMGGMTLMGLADRYPELFGSRITGVVLLSTSAGGVMKSRRAMSFLGPVIAGMAPLLDRGRLFNSYDVVRRWGLGPHAQERHIDMTDEMILSTPTDVIIDFYPLFVNLDLYDSLTALGNARTVVVCGTKDMMAPIKHARTLAELVPGARLVALEGAGHMIMFEEHDRVTKIIAELYEELS